MPLVQTRGAASAQGFGEFAQAATVVNYIEDTFSCFLYTGTGASQTITNNIDLSTKGGLTWIKGRSGTTGHRLTDTARGVTKSLASETTAAEATETTGLTAFGTTGFTIGADADYNTSAATYASWTFRKQPKFFDVQTWTGSGANRTIAHSLGSVPACIMVKRTDTTADWQVYHRSLANTEYLVLNTTDAKATGATRWNSTTPTSSVFSLGTDATVNASAGTYIAYIFAHDAGGFGLTGTDNVISCGSFTTDGSGNATVNLGYEPQWVLRKSSSNAGYPWYIMDNMRGYSTPGGSTSYLSPNDSTAEVSYVNLDGITSTGFQVIGQAASVAFIYIAIRRGPMKVPTTGTSVYNAIARTGTGATANVTGVGFSPDLVLSFDRTNAYGSIYPWRNRLAGKTQMLNSTSTDAEVTEATDALTAFTMDGISVGADATNTANLNTSGVTYIQHFFKRAPSAFDLVCYTGTGSYPFTINHNLGIAPELMIIKTRNAAQSWWTYAKPVTSPNSNWYQNYFILNGTNSSTSDLTSFTSAPTSTTIPVADYYSGSGTTYVVYLFATCAGVSKVGSYTGTGTTKQIDCGFTSGARYVLIKRTNSSGGWYVWDSTRGIVAGNDPYLLINSFAAEVTNTDYIDTYSAGFEISSTAPAAINANGGTFIFLAIA